MKSYFMLIISFIVLSMHPLVFAHQIRNIDKQNEYFWTISTTSNDAPLSITFYYTDKVIHGQILLCDLQQNPKLSPPDNADGYIVLTDSNNTAYNCYYKELHTEFRKVELTPIK